VLSSFGVHCLLNAGLLILQMDYNNDLLCRMARPQLMILLVFLASGFANSEGFVPQAPSVRALPIFFAPGSNSHLAHRVSTSHQKVGSGQIAPPASVQRTESVTMLKLSEGSGSRTTCQLSSTVFPWLFQLLIIALWWQVQMLK